MRLLNVQSLKLEYFTGHNIPPYAILSHTWGLEEVSFAELNSQDGYEKAGYMKIQRSSAIAAGFGISYIWIDTCCIDKSSSAELTEAINSMFRWYQDSKICISYLEGVSDLKNFKTAKWFSRGWTLQELIAPREMVFFSSDWRRLGTKKELASLVSEITTIDEKVLLDAEQLRAASIATRMSWAACRQTTREEDIAYCLLGIFDVNMPLLYGEGKNAFLRLQEEIMKETTDHSLFTWAALDGPIENRGALARHPDEFALAASIIPTGANVRPYFMTNKGLRITLPLIRKRDAPGMYVGVLECHKQGNFLGQFGILLKPVSTVENNVFVRSAIPPEIIEEWRCRKARRREIYIVKNDPLIRSEPRYAWIRRLPSFDSGFRIREISSSSNMFGTTGRTLEVSDQKWRGAVLFEHTSSKTSFIVIFGLTGADQYSTIVHIISPWQEGVRLRTAVSELSAETLSNSWLLQRRRFIRKAMPRGTITASVTWDMMMDKEILILDVSVYRYPVFMELKSRYDEMMYLPWRALGSLRYYFEGLIVIASVGLVKLKAEGIGSRIPLVIYLSGIVFVFFAFVYIRLLRIERLGI